MCNSLNTMTFAGNGAELRELNRKIKKGKQQKEKVQLRVKLGIS